MQKNPIYDVSYFFCLFLLLSFLFTPFALAKLVEYEIDIEYQTVNYTGSDVRAMTVGGTIPGRFIEAAEGDTLRVTFHNKMDVDTFHPLARNSPSQ